MKWVVCAIASIFFYSVTLLAAPPAYIKKAHKIVWDTHRDYQLFEKEEGNLQDILKRSKERLVEIKALDGELVKAVEKVLEGLHYLSPSYVWLKSLRVEIDATIRQTTSTAVRKESKINLDPHEQGGLDLEAVDPTTYDLLQAHIHRGNYEPVLTLLELLTFNIRLQEAYLKNSDMGAVIENEAPHLHWFDYIKVHEHMIYAIQLLRRFFPDFPDPSWGVLLAKGGDDRFPGGLSKFYVMKTVDYFEPVNHRLPDAAKQRIAITMHTIANGVAIVEGYRLRFFPRFEADAGGIFLSNSLFSIKGAHNCLALSKGHSDYVGQTCDFAAFKEALLKYIKYYDQIADHGVLAMALEHILDFFDEGDGERGIPRLQKKLEAIAVKSNVNKNITKVWPQVVATLLEKRDQGNNPDDKNLRELVLGEDPSAVEIYKVLKAAFLKAGVGVCRDGEEQIRECGTFEDATPNLLAAQDILKGFEDNIEGILKKSVLTGTMKDKLSKLSERVRFLDASHSSCKVYLESKREDRATASWVQYSEGFATHRAGREATANGFHKQIWVHKAHIANAVTIQENIEWPKKQLAGASVLAAVHTILPNIVHTQMLLSDGVLNRKTLGGLGITEPKTAPVKYVQARYAFPEFNGVISQAHEAFEDMLLRYAFKYKLLDLGDPKKLTDAIINAQFKKQYSEIARHYRRKHQGEMYIAAKAIRKFDKLYDQFRQPNFYVPKDAPPAIVAITGNPNARAYTQGQHQQINSSIAMLVEKVKFDYLTKRHGITRARQMMNTTVLSTKEFLEAFKLHGVKYVGSYLHREWYWKEKNRGILVKIYEHGLNIYHKRRAYLDYAKDLLFYQFPALKWKDAWKTYDGSYRSYRTVMGAFKANAVSQANRYAKLGEGEDDEDDIIDDILDEVVPNLPLMDMVLRTFPQLKRVLCQEQAARKLVEDRIDNALYAIEATGAVLCFVPVLAPVGGIVTVTAIGVALVAHGYRAYTKYKELENAKAFSTAVGPQLERAQQQNNMLYYREMNAAYGQAMTLFVVDAALAAVTFIKPIRSAIGSGIKNIRGGVRTFGPRALKGMWGYARAFPGRFITLWKAESRAALNPFVRWGVAQKWSTRTLVGRLSPLFRVNRTWLSIPRRFLAVPQQTGKALLEILAHHPWSFFGQQWARTGLSRGIQITWFAAEGLGIYFALKHYFRDREIARVTRTVLENPKAYEDWVILVRGGKISKEELYLLIDMDRELGEAKRKEFQGVVDQIEEEMTSGNNNRERLANLRKNLETVGNQIKAHRDTARKNGGENNPEYQMWARVYGQFQKHQNRLAAFKND